MTDAVCGSDAWLPTCPRAGTPRPTRLFADCRPGIDRRPTTRFLQIQVGARGIHSLGENPDADLVKYTHPLLSIVVSKKNVCINELTT